VPGGTLKKNVFIECSTNNACDNMTITTHAAITSSNANDTKDVFEVACTGHQSCLNLALTTGAINNGGVRLLCSNNETCRGDVAIDVSAATAAVSIACTGYESCSGDSFAAIIGGTDASILCDAQRTCGYQSTFQVDASQTTGNFKFSCTSYQSCFGAVSALAGVGTASLSVTNSNAGSAALVYDASEASSFVCVYRTVDCAFVSAGFDLYTPGSLRPCRTDDCVGSATGLLFTALSCGLYLVPCSSFSFFLDDVALVSCRSSSLTIVHSHFHSHVTGVWFAESR
jgi:hypothetical protein